MIRCTAHIVSAHPVPAKLSVWASGSQRCVAPRVTSVIKVRGSSHSKDVRFFDIVDGTTIIGERLTGYTGVLCGQAVRARRVPRIRKNLQLP